MLSGHVHPCQIMCTHVRSCALMCTCVRSCAPISGHVDPYQDGCTSGPLLLPITCKGHIQAHSCKAYLGVEACTHVRLLHPYQPICSHIRTLIRWYVPMSGHKYPYPRLVVCTHDRSYLFMLATQVTDPRS